MKYIPLILSQVAICCHLTAQDLPNFAAIKVDTLRIDSMTAIAAGLLEEDKAEQAIELYKQAAKEAKKIGDYRRETDNMYEQGNAWQAFGNMDSAQYYFIWTYNNARQNKDLNLYAYALTSLINLWNEQGKDSVVLRMVSEADSLLPNLKGNPANRLMAYGNIGVYFSNKGLRERGLDYYIKGYEAVKSLNDSIRIYPMLMNIASTFSALENEQKAYAYAAEAKQYISPENTRFQALYALQAGLIDERFKKLDSARARLERAAASFESLKRPYEQGTALTGLGRVLALQGKLYEALPIFDKAQKLAEKAGIAMLKARVSYSRGKAYFDASDWGNAGTWLQKAYNQAKLTNETTVLEDATKFLSQTYAQVGNYKAALDMQQEYTAIRDSIISIRTLFSTAEAEARYQNQLLKEQALVKDLTISNQTRTMIILGLLATVAAGAGFFFTYRTRQRKKLEAAQMRNKIATDLHDEVGSTLSSIGMMTDVLQMRLKGSDEKSLDTLQKISANARQTMESMDEIIWTINPQQDAFNNLETRLKNFAYPLIEARQMSSDFQFEEGMDNLKLSMEQRQNIYLVLKEAINNALKYSEADTLTLRGNRNGNHLVLRVTDNGKGFKMEDVNKARNGLGNMQKRAAALSGKLEVQSMPGAGTTVTLTIPV